MKNFKIYKIVCLILTIIGSLNWGLIGIADFNLVTYVFGANFLLTHFVYILIGLSGIFLGFYYFFWERNYYKIST